MDQAVVGVQVQRVANRREDQVRLEVVLVLNVLPVEVALVVEPVLIEEAAHSFALDLHLVHVLLLRRGPVCADPGEVGHELVRDNEGGDHAGELLEELGDAADQEVKLGPGETVLSHDAGHAHVEDCIDLGEAVAYGVDPA